MLTLKWLEKEFVPYLDNWEKWVQLVPNITKTEHNNLLLSSETRLGLRMTCKYIHLIYVMPFIIGFPYAYNVGNSFIELVQYLFTVPGVKSFLSQRICQDPLENFFGCQCQRGGVHDNPNVQEFTKNTQALRVINSFCRDPSCGNCRGGLVNTVMSNKENEPLPKCRKMCASSSKTLSCN